MPLVIFGEFPVVKAVEGRGGDLFGNGVGHELFLHLLEPPRAIFDVCFPVH
jgi:hypothetical protein